MAKAFTWQVLEVDDATSGYMGYTFGEWRFLIAGGNQTGQPSN